MWLALCAWQLNPNVGVFITMNPDYAGRSQLPDNLKQLFRSIAMIKPDWDLIAQVMLFSQGFHTAERLAGKAVLLFSLCSLRFSPLSAFAFLAARATLGEGKAASPSRTPEGHLPYKRMRLGTARAHGVKLH